MAQGRETRSASAGPRTGGGQLADTLPCELFAHLHVRRRLRRPRRPLGASITLRRRPPRPPPCRSTCPPVVRPLSAAMGGIAVPLIFFQDSRNRPCRSLRFQEDHLYINHLTPSASPDSLRPPPGSDRRHRRRRRRVALPRPVVADIRALRPSLP